MSQATPSLASSWAHKYETLFAAYNCQDCLVSTELDSGMIAQNIDDFLTPDRNKKLREKLQIRAAHEKSKVEIMWKKVEKIISLSD